MRRKQKVAKVWTVRNQRGQYLGSFRALTAEQAINRMIDNDRVTVSQFKSYTCLKREDLRATVEER